VLDVCGGTGDLAILAARRTGPAGQVVHLRHQLRHDPRPAATRSTPSRHWSHIGYVQGDAERISFPDNTFDCAMVGFGIRNLTHLRQGFAEMVRALKPGGRFLCLEFSQPTNPVFRSLYDFYSFNIMPALGQLLAGSAESYACLPETIRMFPLPDELAAMLADVGLRGVRWKRLTNGISVAHVGKKLE
jgi:demethylmenaquinone methyltransferase/2-methoxy-6-polyprenyl-1,4-benzoquinol methylase